jgi:hypothetical protein
MPHPNSDFIKKFLGEDRVDPKKQAALLKKQRMDQYYQSLQENKVQPVIAENTKKSIESTIQKIFYREKDTYETALVEGKQFEGNWVEKRTAEGIFYYNAQQDVWMNTFGVIKKTLQELLLFTVGYDGDGKSTTSSSLSFASQSYFSDDGSKLALYSFDIGSQQSSIGVYDISYSPTLTTTLLDTVSLGAVPFTAQSNEKCFVSNDGVHLITSCPTSQSVYLFDVAQNSLLQTITESYSNFGSKIAVDKDFYGMAISTNNLTRDPSSTDTRVSSYSVSSPIMYYKRNFGSNNTQQFKKIHNHNAITNYRHSGLATWVGVGLIINKADYYNDPPAGSLNNTCGINRCDDIACKGYNFAISNIALETDQINYKAQFPNLSNSKFNVIKEVGFTFAPNYTDNIVYKMLGATGNIAYSFFTGITTPIQVYTDEFLTNTALSDYYMEGTVGLKNFSIVRKIDNQYIYDNSYRDSGTIPLSFAPELLTFTNQSYVNPAYDGTFMSKMYGKYASAFSDDAFVRPIRQGAQKGLWDSYERQHLTREESVNAKVCVNTTDTYNINKFITNSIAAVGATGSTQNLNIKNIRIYRFPSTNTAGTDSYMYNDWNYGGSTYSQTPNSLSSGLVKVMYKSSDQSNLESSLSSEIGGNWVAPNPPVLANPTNCPSSEFAYTVSSTILDQDIISCYVSDDRLFINFSITTMIFEIDNTLTYKPLLFEASMSTLSSYSFVYNNSGEFFGKQNNMYKYNRVTHNLDLVNTIG